MHVEAVIEEAKRRRLNICWVVPGDEEYDEKRKIKNAVFSYRPAAIALCNDADSVAGLFTIFYELEGEPPPFRIRSGGHQHEGMCSADDVLLIDLSGLDTVEFVPGTDRREAWIGPGCDLRSVYTQVWKQGRVLPGGGCGSVNAGGLIQGGGWGLWARKFGLACDNLLEADVVLATGQQVIAGPKEPGPGSEPPAVEKKRRLPDLLWALRGGGGGNFGVVTRFKMRLHPFPEKAGEGAPFAGFWPNPERFADRHPHATRFSFFWPREHRREVVRAWLGRQNELPEALTSFLRASVVYDPKQQRGLSVRVGGLYHGAQRDAADALAPLLGDLPEPEKVEYEKMPSLRRLKVDEKRGGSLVDQLIGLSIDSLSESLQPGPPAVVGAVAGSAPPRSTCDGPHPHKVSSAFVSQEADLDRLADQLDRYITQTDCDEKVHRYVSLLGLGGAVADRPSGESAFWFRQRSCLMQFQAWWSQPEDPTSHTYQQQVKRYVKWVTDFRRALDDVDGAFINFPDVSLVEDKDAQRVELLEHYYGGNLEKLRALKAKFDPEGRFSFGMSIPLPR